MLHADTYRNFSLSYTKTVTKSCNWRKYREQLTMVGCPDQVMHLQYNPAPKAQETRQKGVGWGRKIIRAKGPGHGAVSMLQGGYTQYSAVQLPKQDLNLEDTN